MNILTSSHSCVLEALGKAELLSEMQPFFIGQPPKKKELQDYFMALSTRHLKRQIH